MGAQWKAKGKDLAANAKGRMFGKLAKDIMVAARNGADPAANARLRMVMEQARKVSMPKDTLDRAIKKGAGLTGETVQFERVIYEGYAPHQVAVMVECLTDNVNRTVGEVRHAFSKHGGNLGTSGSVAYLFSKRGEIRFHDTSLEDRLMEIALDAGADDVENDGDSITVVTSPEQFGAVQDALSAAGLNSDSAEVTMHAATSADITVRTLNVTAAGQRCCTFSFSCTKLAGGSTMRVKIWNRVNPKVRPASHCPFGVASIPARNISAL